MQWLAEAPANIALIKYMGKKTGVLNYPLNASLSYTLDNLQTSVTLEAIAGKVDQWEPLHIPGSPAFELSEKAKQRYLNHLMRIKTLFNCSSAFLVRSVNNFPHGSGLASSASSFAALTKAALLAICEIQSSPMPTIIEQAELSRQGSGSSCRSFFSPWSIWDDNGARAIQITNYPQLIHQVIIISHSEKAVGSSEAHQRVLSSPHYAERPTRANANLENLLAAFEAKQWETAYQIVWDEFQDMHRLFTSCDKPFKYISAASETILQLVQDYWREQGDGPLVTMDAGPNIHLLYRMDQAELAQTFKQRYLVGQYDVL